MSSSRRRGEKKFIILVHGSRGHASDWNWMEMELERQGCKDSILVSSSNEELTNRGVAECGRRLADEVVAFVAASERLSRAVRLRVTCIGHSLGGLILRYALGLLHEQFRERWDFEHYVSLCSPHLGSRRAQGGLAQTLWRTTVHLALTTSFYGQTGADLLQEDAADPAGAVLARMSEPGGPFMRALAAFSLRTCFGLSRYDFLVGCNAALIRSRPSAALPPNADSIKLGVSFPLLSGLAPTERAPFELASRCPPAVVDEAELRRRDRPRPTPEDVAERRLLADAEGDLEFRADVLEGLCSVPWRRVEVLFHGPLAAHYHDLMLRRDCKGSQMFDMAPGEEFLELFVQFLRWEEGKEEKKKKEEEEEEEEDEWKGELHQQQLQPREGEY